MSNYVDELVEKLLKYRDEYYNGLPTITDEEFDALENKLYLCDPNNEYFTLVGTRDGSNADIVHKIPMLSMQKSKNSDEAENWLFKMYNRYMHETPQSEWFCYYEPKIDGVSGTIRYDSNGKIVYMATRGKGTVGSRINLEKYLIKNKVIPEKINYKTESGFEIRGEFFVPKNINSEMTEDKPLRNITSGIIKSKEVSENIDLLRFVAYDIVFDDGKRLEIEDINTKLKEFGFFSHPKKIIHFDDIKKVYISYIDQYRDEWPFITDGLVLTFPHVKLWNKIDEDYVADHHHQYNMALKPPAQFDYTSILDIEWNISRYGNLIPIGILKTVNINNSNINRVTLVSAGYMEEKKIGKGSTIKIERSNDVIPHILEVAQFPRVKVKLPNNCPVCESELIREGDHLKCINRKCKGIIKAEIVYWFETLGVKGLGKETINKIVDNFKVYDIPSFYDIILEKKFEKIFSDTSEKTKENIYKIVKNSLENITTLDIFTCIGIQSIGVKAYQKLGIYDYDSFMNYVNTLDNDIKTHKRVQIPVVEEKILKWSKNKQNIEKLEKILDYFKDYTKNNTIVINRENAKNIAITGSFEGYTRSDIEKLIMSKGDNPVSTVSKNTHYLINDDGVQMGKYNKALELGIPIIKLEEYQNIK